MARLEGYCMDSQVSDAPVFEPVPSEPTCVPTTMFEVVFCSPRLLLSTA